MSKYYRTLLVNALATNLVDLSAFTPTNPFGTTSGDTYVTVTAASDLISVFDSNTSPSGTLPRVTLEYQLVPQSGFTSSVYSVIPELNGTPVGTSYRIINDTGTNSVIIENGSFVGILNPTVEGDYKFYVTANVGFQFTMDFTIRYWTLVSGNYVLFDTYNSPSTSIQTIS